ncbi:hypothetical protein [Moraxella sp. ZY210820]|uniref:hypothetical protein n=1 Tax=unclassified Moraxella TaxID=2685852 RepID=UPI00272F7CA7|nr:hypothetical protein [Moraxella sp. ZY210820]WLF83428.1 hypothetical protein LU301_09170 [Moraxella sp. ZY210820]
MLPTPHTAQMKEFIERYNRIEGLDSFYESTFKHENNVILYYRLLLNHGMLIYQKFGKDVMDTDTELYFENMEAFYQQVADYPCEKIEEKMFISVNELAYYLSKDRLIMKDYKQAEQQIYHAYEQQYPNTDWCTVSIFDFKAYPVPRHEFATKPEHQSESIQFNSPMSYFNKDIVERLVEWENRFIQTKNDVHQQNCKKLDLEIADKGLNQLLGLPEHPANVAQIKLLNADTEFEKIRKFMRVNPEILVPYVEIILLIVLFSIIMIMGILQFILKIKFGLVVWASLTWIFILFNNVKIISWLAKAKRQYYLNNLYPKLWKLYVHKPNKLKTFWRTGTISQKWALGGLMMFSLYLICIALGLSALWTKIAFYITLGCGGIYCFYYYKT